MSRERRSHMPNANDGLTHFFKPSLFESSPVPHDETVKRADRWTAVLPVPITRRLLSVYRFRNFMPLLVSIGLAPFDVELLTNPEHKSELGAASGCRYGFVVVSGSLQCVERAIDAVVAAVENAVPAPPAAADASTASDSSSSDLEQPCPWSLMGQESCDRARCGLSAVAHDSYLHNMMRHLDTSPRPLSAVPYFTYTFSFIVCRTPAADSDQWLCSLCVPNSRGVRGFIIGRKGNMRKRVERETGTTPICNGQPFDTDAVWMTVSATGSLATVDSMVEILLFLHEAQEAAAEQIIQHLSEWRRQRAVKLDRPAMWSLMRRGVHSPQLTHYSLPPQQGLIHPCVLRVSVESTSTCRRPKPGTYPFPTHPPPAPLLLPQMTRVTATSCRAAPTLAVASPTRPTSRTLPGWRSVCAADTTV